MPSSVQTLVEGEMGALKVWESIWDTLHSISCDIPGTEGQGQSAQVLGFSETQKERQKSQFWEPH